MIVKNALPKHNPQYNPNPKKSNAVMLDRQELAFFNAYGKDLYEKLKWAIRIQEEQEFISCFKWYGLPEDISSEFLERLMYYKGTLCFFYYEPTKRFYFMPYNFRGSLDFYGRIEEMRAIPFYQSKKEKDADGKSKEMTADQLLLQYALYNVKNVDFSKVYSDEELMHSAVILNDYTPQFSQNSSIEPRQAINDSFICKQADILSLLYTNLIAGSGVKGIKVPSAEAKKEALSVSKDIENSAKLGCIYIPILSSLDLQELSSNTRGKVEEYLMAYQSIDNLRKSMFGLSNNGVYEKKTQMLQDELGQRMSEVNTILKNRLNERQHFCLIANSIWGTNLWCDYSEEVIDNDMNKDGKLEDDKTSENITYNNETNNIGGNDNV